MKKQFNHPDYKSSKLQQSIIEVLESSTLWSMATVNENGASHINTAYFCYDDEFNFYFLTSPNAVHSLNLLKNSSVAVSVFNTNQPWGSGLMQGVQIFGTAKIIDSTNEVSAFNEYGKRFSGFLNWMKSLNDEEKSKIESKFYCLTPTSLKLFDEKNFGEETLISIKL